MIKRFDCGLVGSKRKPQRRTP